MDVRVAHACPGDGTDEPPPGRARLERQCQTFRPKRLWPDALAAGDTLVVPALDRYGRSLQDLITMVGELRKSEIGFTSLHERLDTTTPGGRLVFHVFAALAEFIRELIVSGTREGLAAARARGKVGGRPTVVNADIIRAARDMRAQRALEAARELGVEYTEQVQQSGQDAWARIRAHQGGAAA